MTTTTRATGKVVMQDWKDERYADVEGAPKLTLDRVKYTFSGDIEGEATAEILNAYRDDTAATYCGYQRVVGKLAGRSGSFVIHVTGKFENGAATNTWSIVPGMGTGQLAELRGEGGYVSRMDGSEPYKLDYHFG